MSSKSVSSKNLLANSGKKGTQPGDPSGSNSKYIYYALILILPLLTAYYYYQTALSANGFLSFPLDDSWIHLTFARNIAEFFSFSYYKNEVVTAGSTSPLYTLIVAIGFFITSNEMILSYVVGVLFFILASFYFYKLNLTENKNEVVISLLFSLVFVFDYWMNFIALSGMETTLFIFLLIFGAYLYKTNKIIPLGIVLALILWTRPDGIAFIAAIILDKLYNGFFIKEKKTVLYSKKELFISIGIFLALTAMYFGFNLYLSGTILPNTYRAKVYEFTDFDQRWIYIKNVWGYFTVDTYKFMMAGFIISILLFIKSIIKRENSGNSLYIFFIIFFLFIHVMKIPAFTRFGRYLMPLIPFFILVSLMGYKQLFEMLSGFIKGKSVLRIAFMVVIAAILSLNIYYFNLYKSILATEDKYIYDRQVKTALWLEENTEKSDIIGAHDIGALGYYSGRKIVDVAGLITPELGEHLNDENYSDYISDYMASKGVTYTAFLREWYVIKNQKHVYQSPGNAVKEVMIVNKFTPGKTRVLSKKVNNLMMKVSNALQGQNSAEIVSLMNEVLKLDPDYSLAYYYRAYGYILDHDYENYENDILKCIELYPEFAEAYLSYGGYYMGIRKFEKAKEIFEKGLKIDPYNKLLNANLKSVNDKLNSQILK